MASLLVAMAACVIGPKQDDPSAADPAEATADAAADTARGHEDASTAADVGGRIDAAPPADDSGEVREGGPCDSGDAGDAGDASCETGGADAVTAD